MIFGFKNNKCKQETYTKEEIDNAIKTLNTNLTDRFDTLEKETINFNGNNGETFKITFRKFEKIVNMNVVAVVPANTTGLVVKTSIIPEKFRFSDNDGLQFKNVNDTLIVSTGTEGNISIVVKNTNADNSQTFSANKTFIKD